MASTANIAYSALKGITITQTSLASAPSSGRESTAIDNSSDLYVDALCYFATVVTAGATYGTGSIYYYTYVSVDGTNYTDNATGTDAALIQYTPSNLKLAYVAGVGTAPQTIQAVFPVAQTFGGVMPKKWGVVVVNNSGLVLTAAGNTAAFIGITYTAT